MPMKPMGPVMMRETGLNNSVHNMNSALSSDLTDSAVHKHASTKSKQYVIKAKKELKMRCLSIPLHILYAWSI